MRWGASCVESDVDSPESSRSWLLILASHPSAKNADEWGTPFYMCFGVVPRMGGPPVLRLRSVRGHVISVEGIFPFHFSHHLLPKRFTIFVEGVCQVGKSPVCGLVVLCGQEPGTELADFGFGGHEVSGKVPSKMPDSA